MKAQHVLVALILVALTASPAASAEFFDDFEAYDAGSTIRGQGEWTTWDDSAAADTQVSDEQSFSGAKSLLITGSADIVRIFRTMTFGTWTVKAQVYVSSEQTGTTYFLLLNTYNHKGPYSWSVELAMNPTKGTIVSNISGSQSLPLIVDEWVEIAVEIDLDNDLHSISYNGEEFVIDAPYKNDGKTALECIDLYSYNDGANKTFIDDIGVSTTMCIPVEVVRTAEMTGGATTLIEGVETPAYAEGDALSVTLSISNVRGVRPGCPALGDVTIAEQLPEGWAADTISNGGSFADGKIVWAIPAAQVAAGQLTYKASGPVKYATVGITGTITEKGNSLVTPIGGEDIPTVAGGLAANGAIVSWLLLGPFQHTGTGTTTNAGLMQKDYLTDGDTITEANAMPAAGDEVDTDYNGKAASKGLTAVANPDINPNGVPQWFAWRDKDVMVSFDDALLFGAVDSVMCYAVCYLCADEATTVTLRAGSDDSIQILLGDDEVWINPVERAWPGLVDVVQVDLERGTNRLMVKIFETGGGWNFGVSMTDENGDALPQGVFVTLDPKGCGTPLPPGFKRGDVNADGGVNIADAIALLGHLFGHQPAPVCPDAGDANDDGQLNIADAIKILGHLFGHAGPLPAPFGSCGQDGTPNDTLSECKYPQDKC